MAYLLDTNIVSEIRKNERAAPTVLAWYRRVALTDIFLSVLVLGEIRRGIELRRRRDPQAASHLDQWLAGLIQQHTTRILPVSLEVANLWGYLRMSQPMPEVDGLLAATALHHNLTLVTRNTADVVRAGVLVLNPFENSGPDT